jgi:DNA-binding FadR family transcriptional regulator
MGISRAMAREVLQVLHQKQLVALHPRAGATVLAPAQWDVFDQDVIRWRLRSAPRLQMRSLTEIRQAIEPRAANLAAQRASAEVCRDLISLSRRLRMLGTDKEAFKDLGDAGEKHRGEYSDVDVQFHETLLKGSGNEMFLALARPTTKALRFRIEQDWAGTPGRRDRTEPTVGEPIPFPRLPVPASLWFHHGLAYSIDQGHPAAAEAFASAIVAEFRTGGLDDPVLCCALGHALDLLDEKGFQEGDWELFAEVVTYVIDHGRAKEAEGPEDAASM